MVNIYIYPRVDINKIDSPNPYVDNLVNSLSKKYIIVNKSRNNIGVIDIYLNILKTDVFLFNWIEELGGNKFGNLQSTLFIMFLILVKILDKKIIWVLHNKSSHAKKKKRTSIWYKIIFRLMIQRSTLIITHSYSGVEFVKEKFPIHWSKVRYYIHPVENKLLLNGNDKSNKSFDFLIWGTIYPYKGIVEFLHILKKMPEGDKIKIVIAGICPDSSYKNILQSYLSENITFIDRYLRIEEVFKLAKKSRFVLFTYSSDSVLSSGSLMDTIRMGVPIIGPNKGAFKDLSKYEFIYTYKDFSDVLEIYNSLRDEKNLKEEIIKFCKENSWDKFGEALSKEIDSILL